MPSTPHARRTVPSCCPHCRRRARPTRRSSWRRRIANGGPIGRAACDPDGHPIRRQIERRAPSRAHSRAAIRVLATAARQRKGRASASLAIHSGGGRFRAAEACSSGTCRATTQARSSSVRSPPRRVALTSGNPRRKTSWPSCARWSSQSAATPPSRARSPIAARVSRCRRSASASAAAMAAGA